MTGNVARQAIDAQNLERAMRLRVRGAHWNEIAAACGFASPAAALTAVGLAMQEATQRAAETAEQLRDTANLQLDALMSEAWKMLDESAPYDAEGNQPDDRAVRLRALDEMRRLVESKAKINRLDKTAADGSDDVPVIRVVGVQIEDII